MRYEIQTLLSLIEAKYGILGIRMFISRVSNLKSHISYPISILLLALSLSSCENDLNKVKEISSNEVGTIIEPTTGVDLILSDSAKVRLHLTAPLLLQYQTKKPYKVMPKGVKIIFYDKVTQKESGNIIADTGILHAGDKLYEFRKNVVATNAQGDVYKSDELFWDSATKKVYSHKNVEVFMKSGNVMNGDNFESDDSFAHPVLNHSKGVFHVDENTAQ